MQFTKVAILSFLVATTMAYSYGYDDYDLFARDESDFDLAARDIDFDGEVFYISARAADPFDDEQEGVPVFLSRRQSGRRPSDKPSTGGTFVNTIKGQAPALIAQAAIDAARKASAHSTPGRPQPRPNVKAGLNLPKRP